MGYKTKLQPISYSTKPEQPRTSTRSLEPKAQTETLLKKQTQGWLGFSIGRRLETENLHESRAKLRVNDQKSTKTTRQQS